jgi:hypothetical protein
MPRGESLACLRRFTFRCRQVRLIVKYWSRLLSIAPSTKVFRPKSFVQPSFSGKPETQSRDQFAVLPSGVEEWSGLGSHDMDGQVGRPSERETSESISNYF